jgi:hypothetical protein
VAEGPAHPGNMEATVSIPVNRRGAECCGLPASCLLHSSAFALGVLTTALALASGVAVECVAELKGVLAHPLRQHHSFPFCDVSYARITTPALGLLPSITAAAPGCTAVRRTTQDLARIRDSDLSDWRPIDRFLNT